MDTKELAEQLRAVERRYAPPGETGSVAFSKQLADWRVREADREEVCNTRDATNAWLLMRLCARYGIRPFRRPRQKPTTICLRAPAGFVSKVLWPQLGELARVFERARAAAVSELVSEWIGPEAAGEALTIDEEPAVPP